jgi:predicted  nucleic acid-binding Zn-ribbon protein
MTKKLLLVAVVAVVGLAAVKSTKFFGYAKQEIESARLWAEDQIPVEKEISRLRKEVEDLNKDTVAVRRQLAESRVDLRVRKQDAEELRSSVKADEDRLHARAKAIPTGKDNETVVTYGRHTMTIGEAKAQLQTDVAALVSRKNTLDSHDKAVVQHERIKDTLERQLDEMDRQKRELTIQVDALEAEYKALQLQQMESKHQTDTTRLAGIKESLAGLKRKVDIKREELKLAPVVRDNGPAVPTTTQTVDEIMAPLSKGEAGKKSS